MNKYDGNCGWNFSISNEKKIIKNENENENKIDVNNYKKTLDVGKFYNFKNNGNFIFIYIFVCICV